jgi:hypothetical protein
VTNAVPRIILRIRLRSIYQIAANYLTMREQHSSLFTYPLAVYGTANPALDCKRSDRVVSPLRINARRREPSGEVDF